MNDPFDVLHDPPELAPVRHGPDETFRSRVLGEARARLERSDRWWSDLEPASINVEPITMPGTAQSPNRRRPLLLAAASIVLLALGVTGIVALSGGDADPDPTDAGRAGAVEPSAPGLAPPSTASLTTPPTPPPTSAPSTSAPSPTTTASPTTAPSPTTAALPGPPELDAALLTPDAYGDGWVEQSGSYRAITFDPSVQTSQCEAYEPDVFGPMRAAATAIRVYRSPEPVVDLSQHFVAVLPSLDAAKAVFAGLTSPGFQQCAITHTRMFDALRFGAADDAPTPSGVDDAVWFRYGRDLTPDLTRSYLAIFFRVGRVVVYVDGFTGLGEGFVTLTDDRFSAAVDAAVAAAEKLDT